MVKMADLLEYNFSIHCFLMNPVRDCKLPNLVQCFPVQPQFLLMMQFLNICAPWDFVLNPKFVSLAPFSH